MPKTRYKTSTRETDVMYIEDQYRSHEDDGYRTPCTNPTGHLWIMSQQDGQSYCEYCLVASDA